MKNAAGEANLTVVAIILITVVVAVATPIIRSLMKTAAYRSCCTDAGLIWQNGSCRYPKSDGEKWYENNKEKEYWECTKKEHLGSKSVLVEE